VRNSLGFGKLFAWGSNNYSQLGLPDFDLKLFLQPIEVPLLDNQNCWFVACGEKVSGLLINNGEL